MPGDTSSTVAVSDEAFAAAKRGMQQAAKAKVESPLAGALAAAAPLIVAAELRRLAGQEFAGNGAGHVRVALHARADQLDPQD